MSANAKKWRPNIEATDRAVLHFVRWLYGMDLVQHDEKVKGWKPDGFEANVGGSRRTKPASDCTYVRHPELPDVEYDRFLTLQKKRDFVLEKLGPDIKHIHREDTDRRFRMPYKAARRLSIAYKEIAIECNFREPVPIRRSFELSPEEWEQIKSEASRLGTSVNKLLRQRALGESISKSQ